VKVKGRSLVSHKSLACPDCKSLWTTYRSRDDTLRCRKCGCIFGFYSDGRRRVLEHGVFKE